MTNSSLEWCANPSVPGGAMAIIEPKTSAEFAQYYALRWSVLQQLSADYFTARVISVIAEKAMAEEWHCIRKWHGIHKMAIAAEGHAAVGVGRGHIEVPGIGMVRYMAVAPEYQCMNIGSVVLNALESDLRTLGAGMVVLNARDNATKFYEKHGYRIVGPIIVKHSPHPAHIH